MGALAQFRGNNGLDFPHISLWDRFFDDAFFHTLPVRTATQANEFELEVPGVKKEDIKVSLEDGMLRVDWTTRKGVKMSDYRSVGRATGVKAKLDNGVLYISLQRPEADKIEVTIE